MKELVFNNKTGDFNPSGLFSSIKILNCNDLQLDLSDCKIQGAGGGNQRPLITVFKSPRTTIKNATLYGLADGSSIESWKKTVPNGVLICPYSYKASIKNITTKNLHMGVVARAESFSIESGKMQFCSGDFIHIQANNFSVVNVDMRYSLAVWSYNEIHRDAIQCYQYSQKKVRSFPGGARAKVLSNGVIKNNLVFFPNDKGIHSFCETADGIMGTDGVFENIEIAGNRVFIENQNGIRFAPMLNGKILNDNEVRHARFFK